MFLDSREDRGQRVVNWEVQQNWRVAWDIPWLVYTATTSKVQRVTNLPSLNHQHSMKNTSSFFTNVYTHNQLYLGLLKPWLIQRRACKIHTDRIHYDRQWHELPGYTYVCNWAGHSEIYITSLYYTYVLSSEWRVTTVVRGWAGITDHDPHDSS